MATLVEFPLEGDDYILVEIEETNLKKGGQKLVSRDGQMVVQAKKSFIKALDQIKPVAQAMIAKLRNLTDKPDEIEIKFGMNLNSEAGAVIAKAGVAANFEITLKYQLK